jgi:hypothetical protein
MKSSIEDVIRSEGNKGKGNLIKTKKLVNVLHEALKSDLSLHGSINSENIYPPIGYSNGELKLAGILKAKDQDVAVQPNNSAKSPKILTLEGILNGTNDKFGKDHTEKILSINVRSQLSSFAKNFDTLYERTFAESFNLHKRCPKMVLGELYMIAVNEYDVDSAKLKTIVYKKNNNIEKHIEKYLLAFQAINNRVSITDDYHKYERVCLLIVDFGQKIPKVYNTDQELINDGLLLSNHKGSISNLNYPTFIDDLLKIYVTRFGNDRFS